MVVTELVTNAVLHTTAGAVELRLLPADGLVRVEVEDDGRGLPVRGRQSSTAMTGRGLGLVAALSRAWGVETGNPERKVVWAEVPLAPEGLAQTAPDMDVDALLASWEDGDDVVRYTVRLGAVPTDLLLEAKAHVDNIVREFALATLTDLPAHLATLVPDVVSGFAEARVAIKAQALDAARRSAPETELVLRLPATAAAAGEAYLAAMDEVDSYARDAQLLTLATPERQRAFRHWYVQSLVDQLRALSRGQEPPPQRPFRG